MNSDYIAYESMMAARDAANAAYWSMIATWIYGASALIGSLATLGAVYVAYRTMNTWRHQEEVKDKKKLKAALVMYRNELVHMPYEMLPENRERKELTLRLNEVANEIYLPLVIMEEDLDKGELGKKIYHFLKLHHDYLQAKTTRQELAICLSELLMLKIIDIKNGK